MESTHSKPTRYGCWPSPISAELVAGSAVQFDELRADSAGLWWLERHPEQGGRVDIRHHAQGLSRSCLPVAYSCRSRVHEYGGGSYCNSPPGVFFVNDSDQNIYLLSDANEVHRLTSDSSMRYADLVFDHARNRLLCIQEQHCDNTGVQNSLVAIDPASGKVQTLASGHDFYASPRPSADGRQLAWLCWDHPDMPWDAAELWLAECDDRGACLAPRRIAGGADSSVFQPEWSPDGDLHFIDDRTGWWNLYRYHHGQAEALYACEMEFGLPQWVFGQRSYSFIDAHRLLCSFIDAGTQRLGMLDTRDARLDPLDTGYTSFSCIGADAQHGYAIAASDAAFSGIVRLALDSGASTTLASASAPEIDPRYFSRPQALEFCTRHGDSAHAFFYPPCNPDIAPERDEQPPLIVITHGGPTARNDTALDLRKQFWTSRGFALLDVNYSGSSGYGRAYRDRLRGQWGIRDAEDCCDAAKALVDDGRVDADRLIIKGSSAGGYTVLCALAFHDEFAAGASYYGIGDLEALVHDTHKFEAHYLDRLVGPYPQMRERYRQRSPIHAVGQLNCPVIFFQGEDDRVVPQQQSISMFEALRHKGVATCYLGFRGEAHGFRKAETIIACLEAELEFYQRVLELRPAGDSCTTLRIENLPT